MKSKFLLPFLALVVLLVLTTACLPDTIPTDDTPEIATATPVNSTSAPTLLPNGSPTAVPATVQPATPVPGLPATATVAPSVAPTALPGQTSQPTAAPTAAPTSTQAGVTSATATLADEPSATPAFTPTATPVPPTPRPGISFQIVNNTNYMDTYGDFHVIGEVKNIGSSILTQMELAVVIKDSTGKSLLKDKNNQVVSTLNFSPMLTNLAPGATSPFGFVLYAGSGTPDANSVTVMPVSQSTSSTVQASVEIQQAQMVPNGLGDYLISGMVVNKTSKPVIVRDLAASVANSDANILAAAYSVDYTVYLQGAGDPNKLDSSPFYLRVTSPASLPTAFKIYLDAEDATPASHNLNITASSHYFDGQGVFHIVGTLTNNSNVTLSTNIVAGLYDKNGVVLDAYSTGSPVNVDAGEIIPFDISTFENVNNSAAAAAALDHFTVQVDNYLAFVPAVNSVKLVTSNDTIQKTTTDWTVTGKVTNSSGQVLSIETVLVGIYDGNGVLMAVNYGWILPTGDSIAKGSVDPYSVVVSLDPKANVTGYTIKTLVRGELK